MLSTDRAVFDADSAVRARMEEYAKTLGKLSVIVLCDMSYAPTISTALSLYPTNSRSRWSRVGDALKIGKTLGATDVVTAQDPFETGWAGAKIAKYLKAPLHVQVHTDFLAPGFSSAHWPLNMIRLWIAPRVLKRAARIRVVSERIKEHIEKKYHPKAPTSVLPIFVDTDSLAHIQKTHHPKFNTALLVVARLEKEKRVDVAIRALKKARDAGLDCGLTIVGSGSEEGNLKHLAKTLGVSQWVEFAGFQNNLIPYYASAQALLYVGAPYEGYGMGIIEALAAGVPVLAEDVGIARQAGATIAEGDFGDALVGFLKKGLPVAQSLFKPYTSKEQYLKKFQEDLALTLTHTQ